MITLSGETLVTHTTALTAAVSILALAASSAAHAGGFQLNERSTKALGTSLAGSVSAASDASFAGFNPAALSTVERAEVTGAAHFVAPIADGTVLLNGQEVDADQAAVLPSFAAGYRVSDDIVVGVTAYSPFGLITDYEADFVGAFDAQTSRLTTLTVAPTVSWQPADGLSLGASVDLLYADARLDTAAVQLDGDTYDVGFSVGALYEPIEGTQLGVAYHHGYHLDLEGNNTVSVLPGSPTFDMEAEAKLPAYVMAGITQDVTPDLRLMAEGRWIGWSSFDTINISTPNAPSPDLSELSEEQRYEDSWLVALGAEYDVNDRFTVRGGVAYDETPTTDEHRTPRVPDEDRVWFSVGTSYNMNENFTLDASYSYLHALDDADVQLRTVPTSVEYDGGAHILSVGGSVRF